MGFKGNALNILCSQSGGLCPPLKFFLSTTLVKKWTKDFKVLTLKTHQRLDLNFKFLKAMRFRCFRQLLAFLQHSPKTLLSSQYRQ